MNDYLKVCQKNLPYPALKSVFSDQSSMFNCQFITHEILLPLLLQLRHFPVLAQERTGGVGLLQIVP